MAKILIVEDNIDLSSIYKSELEYNGYIVDVLLSGAGVIEKIKEFEPDMILLDIMLPDADGLDILQAVKEEYSFAKIKVIIMSNIDAPAVVNRAYTLKADGYLIKSMLLPSQLTDEVKSFLT